MRYDDVINHSSIKNYFGANSEEWIDSLNSLVGKKEIGEMHVDDPDARKLLSNTYKFSFLVSFFIIYGLPTIIQKDGFIFA